MGTRVAAVKNYGELLSVLNTSPPKIPMFDWKEETPQQPIAGKKIFYWNNKDTNSDSSTAEFGVWFP
jgi:hypothetical protein